MVHASFVMEQHLGHQTYYQNLRRHVEQSGEIQAHWVPVTYTGPASLLERLALLPASLHGTMRGRAEVRAGLQADSDVLFFNTQVPAVLGGRLTRRRPYVIATDLTPIQYDGMSLQYGHQPDRPGPLKQYKHMVNVRLLRGAAKLLPWSTWARDSMIQDYGVDPSRVEVLPPGVDLAHWVPGSKTDGPMRVLFVGGDLHRKGGATLIDAFRLLPPGSAELVLVTRTPIPQEPGIRVYHHLQPNDPELMALYRSADVFVLPSEAEAFGIAAAEASASGLPGIVTAVGGLTDIVLDGETGFTVAPRDVRALALRLRLLADQPALRERLGRAARERAESQFDTRRNAMRVIDCLTEATHARHEVAHAV